MYMFFVFVFVSVSISPSTPETVSRIVSYKYFGNKTLGIKIHVRDLGL